MASIKIIKSSMCFKQDLNGMTLPYNMAAQAATFRYRLAKIWHQVVKNLPSKIYLKKPVASLVT